MFTLSVACYRVLILVELFIVAQRKMQLDVRASCLRRDVTTLLGDLTNGSQTRGKT